MSVPAGPALFVRTGALGDFCLSTPSLAALYRLGGRVDLVCEPRFAWIAERVAEAVAAEAEAPTPERDERRASPPRGVATVSTPRGRVWAAGGLDSLWLHAGPDPVGYRLGLACSAAHADALRALGVPDVRWVSARPAPDVPAWRHFGGLIGPPVPVRIRADAAPTPPPGADRSGPYAVLAPGSAGAEKRWPMERWRAVAGHLAARGVAPRWVGGPLEEWATDRPDLPGLAALAAGAVAFLGADSGPAHLAALAGARVGVVARPASLAWLPAGAEALDWGMEPEAVADWACGAGAAARESPAATAP